MAGTAADDAAARWIRIVLLIVTATGGGFGAAQGVDLFGAKEWQQANVEKLMEAERLSDRLLQCRAKVDAFEQQNAMLIDLVNRLQSARHEGEGRRPGPLPALPRME